jgi:phage terminase small subunit
MIKLRDKQLKFANYVLEGKTQAEAYRLAGYNGKSVDTNASEILRNPQVLSYIEERKAQITKKIEEKTDWTVQRLIEEFQVLKDRCMQAEPVYDAKGRPTGEYKFEAPTASRALENIAKIIGA